MCAVCGCVCVRMCVCVCVYTLCHTTCRPPRPATHNKQNTSNVIHHQYTRHHSTHMCVLRHGKAHANTTTIHSSNYAKKVRHKAYQPTNHTQYHTQKATPQQSTTRATHPASAPHTKAQSIQAYGSKAARARMRTPQRTCACRHVTPKCAQQ